ncbi:STAS domain-containing protein [Streptomyces virginiae]|uniref:STAS domain-containing protein n=1 Tax=Streptomyces virginiae TaxID=1961 RepID=UPI002E281D3D|nr:STAS domain-containing protein [Streptomyces virginiae]
MLMHSTFEIHIRHYGATLHVTPVGELDVDCDQALNEVRTAFHHGVAVVACDMRRLTFLDLTGLHYLLDLARNAQSRGIAFFAYNWQHQPQQLLDRADDLAPPDGRGRRAAPTRILRRTLRQAAASAADPARAGTGGRPETTGGCAAAGPDADTGMGRPGGNAPERVGTGHDQYAADRR